MEVSKAKGSFYFLHHTRFPLAAGGSFLLLCTTYNCVDHNRNNSSSVKNLESTCHSIVLSGRVIFTPGFQLYWILHCGWYGFVFQSSWNPANFPKPPPPSSSHVQMRDFHPLSFCYLGSRNIILCVWIYKLIVVFNQLTIKFTLYQCCFPHLSRQPLSDA